MVGEAWEPPHYEEWWEAGGIVVKEYHTWEKIVTIVFKGEEMRLAANDVQLVSRPARRCQQSVKSKKTY
jgi:hypothetical protein